MSKLLIKIIVVIAMFLLVDRLVGTTIQNVAQSKVYDKRLKKILKHDFAYDILIMGSSRAARDIIANDITKTTGVRAFNLGYPGSNIDFHDALLKLIIKSGHIPKIIILLVDDHSELIENDSINFRKDVFYPYLNTKEINNIFYYRGEISKLSNFVKTYQQRNNLTISLFKNATINKLSEITDDGSMPLTIKSEKYKDMAFGNMTTYNINNESIYLTNKFLDFVELCKLNTIKLVIVFPPNYSKPSHGFVNRIKKMAGSYPIYVDYSELIKDKYYFYDISHLDYRGARILSKAIGDNIKNCVK